MNLNPDAMLRAEGNLSYLDYIRLVKKAWEDGHPEVPIVPVTISKFAQYPCITYQLDLRKPLQSEPKPRYREVLEDDEGKIYSISAQRFQNVVTFTAVDDVLADYRPVVPLMVEELIEVFEDFILEYMPIFKRLGASDLFYARRLPDDVDENAAAPALVKRAISYLLTTEKVVKSETEKLQSVLVDLRIWTQEGFPQTSLDGATPDIDVDLYDNQGLGGPLEDDECP